MDLELLQLAIKSIANELQENKIELLALRAEVKELKRSRSNPVTPEQEKKQQEEDELLTLQKARTVLGISRNTFLAMVRDGILKPIRMNLRTIRYSRREIQRYILTAL